MNRADDITSRIQGWVYQEFPVARRHQIGPLDSLLDSGIVDSMGTLEVVAFVEQEFGVQVTDEEMVADHFQTIASISALVHSKLGLAQATAGMAGTTGQEDVDSEVGSQHRSV